MSVLHIHFHFPSDPGVPTDLGKQILTAVESLKERIIMNQQELKDSLQALSDQTDKIFNEVKGQLTSMGDTIASLQDALAQAGNTSAEVDELMTKLADQHNKLDGLIPDPEPQT